MRYIYFYVLLLIVSISANVSKKKKEVAKNVSKNVADNSTRNGTASSRTAEKTKSHNFNLPIIDVIKKISHDEEETLGKNLFEIAKEFTGVDKKNISTGFRFSPGLSNYIQKHSYEEVLWCFKLPKQMTFYKTFERIKAMEPSNLFTIHSATGKKLWPAGKNPRHVVCDTISKQPITNGLYDEFLNPARAQYFRLTVKEFDDIKKIFMIEKLSRRYEFAQSLNIESVEKKIRLKIIDAIEKKLKTLSFETIKLRDDRAKGIHGDKPQLHSSMFKLIANAYGVSHSALNTVMNYYIPEPKKLSILNIASLRGIGHFTKTPNPFNTSFGKMYHKMNAAMADLETMLKTPLIIALDKNHIQHSILNKTLLNIMIITAKEPGGIITSFYQLPTEIRSFIETTRMSKFHILISQSKIRLEHLSIDFFVNLLKKQTVAALSSSTLRYDPEEIDKSYLSSIKNIIEKSTLIDFQRIYHKSWRLSQLKDLSLLHISIEQGLTGNEFLQVYGLESKNISDVTYFSNYTFGMIRTIKERDLLSYTLKELGEMMKNDIEQSGHSRPTTTTIKPKVYLKENTLTKVDKTDAESNSERNGQPMSLMAIPILLCTLALVSGLLGWIYHSRRKEMYSAW